MYLTIGGCATGGKFGECKVEYPGQGKSSYVLPWTVGETYRVVNTNCGRGQTHNGLARFAYDFQMPVGTIIRASRGGTVISVNEQFQDYNRTPGDENWIFVRHDDGTVARYYHLTQEGSFVEAGSVVSVGQRIGRSGATGYIGFQSIPHLHFDVTAQECGEFFFGSLCATVPITFRNTRAHSAGLVDREEYTAVEY
jgi:murein DD-endopeptidase MepM/ murein hydrolase activator NlpD